MKILKEIFQYTYKHPLVLLIIIVGSILGLIPFIFDGTTGCVKEVCGFIVGTNYRDGIWYQAVAASAFKTFPFRMPNFAGETLTGYHYIPNLVSYILSYIGIPISVSFYQIFPLIFMLGVIIFSILFARTIFDKPAFVFFFLFFTLFGIPLTLLTSLYHKGIIDNYLLINTFQSTRVLESIHFAFSFLILLIIFLLIQKPVITWKKRICISFFIFLVFGIKFYTAVAIVIILGCHELFLLIKKKNFQTFFLNALSYTIGALISIFIFYDPLNTTNSGSIFIFAPFSTVHHIIEEPDLLYMKDMVNARYFLQEHGWSPRLLLIELFSSVLFVVFYFGTKVIGFVYILKQILTKKITRFELSLTIALIICILLSILFIQKGDWFNPIQFAVVAAFIMNFFAAKTLYNLWQHKLYFYIIGSLIFIITIPAHFVNLNYFNNDARLVILQAEINALTFLKQQPDGIVFAPIIDADMAYVSAFTGKQTYVNFLNVLDNNGINYARRIAATENMETIDIDKLNLHYIYIPYTYTKFEQLKQKCITSSRYTIIYDKEQVVICEKTI
ncbi:MAG TPA: hypothetical protein PLS49_04110 [Candidatus Woesebacteria bacterium]|nr:hypothetical protein [Candidatus Woesebacteria bacterium]